MVVDCARIGATRSQKREMPRPIRRSRKEANYLIFVDTNILLDFYRARNANASKGIELLELIEQHKDILITGEQVEMEFKKSRQKVILEMLKAQKLPDYSSLAAPAFLIEAKPARGIEKNKKGLLTQVNRLKGRIVKVLGDPAVNDPVYKTLQRVFATDSEYNLSRQKKIRYTIRNLARKRFILGYPPRKQGDTSIGDAINWEWIVRCAEVSGKDVILVTRDSDYGIVHNDQHFLNDWLLLEFKKRVSQQRKIVLTDRLAFAFDLAAITVSDAAKTEELARLREADLRPPLSHE